MSLTNPKLYVHYKVFQKSQQYCRNAYDPKSRAKERDLLEISGMGAVYPTTDGNFLWDDIMLMPQSSGMGHTDFNQDKVLDLMQRLIDGGQQDKLEHLWLWWHSHVNMGTTPSSIDTGTIEDWHRGGMGKLVTVVTNVHGAITARFDQWEPTRLKVPLEPIIHVPYTEEGLDETLAEIKENVKWERWMWPHYSGKGKGKDDDDEHDSAWHGLGAMGGWS